MQNYDAIVVGGGPSGSTCASSLVQGGARVLLLDGATFPREKLCAGWLGPPIWDILELSPREYSRNLWAWNKGRVHFGGRSYTVDIQGYFIRRHEFDEFLLRRCKATVIEGHLVRKIERQADGNWCIDDQYQAKFLIGAGGSHCPVSRSLFPKRAHAPCGTQEKEFEADPQEIAAYRAGEDGEPEILLHDNLKGYSWNVPKTGWMNIGTGTKNAKEVLPAWEAARAFFEQSGGKGTIPPSARPKLDKMKGHGYCGYAPEHLVAGPQPNVFIVGDSLGLAHPTTGEGICPAILSGKLCGKAIAAGAPQDYMEQLRHHPMIQDYQVLYSGRRLLEKLLGNYPSERFQKSALLSKLVVDTFSYLFADKPLPQSRVLRRLAVRAHARGTSERIAF